MVSDIDVEYLSRHRAAMENFSKLVVASKDITSEKLSVEGLNCEWIHPKFHHRKDKVILYCHGGGFICGGLNYAKILASKMAVNTGLSVLSFEYKLAPEHTFPTQIDETDAIWNYLLYLGYGARNIIVAGDSAGGNLALELVIGLRDSNRLLPGGVLLFSPWTDLRAVSGTYESCKDKDPIITYEYITMVRDAYVGDFADFENPRLSPLLADLHGLPPMLVQVGSNEVLRDDSVQLVKRVIAAKGYAKLEKYSGGWHVFQQMPIPLASKAMEAVGRFADKLY